MTSIWNEWINMLLLCEMKGEYKALSAIYCDILWYIVVYCGILWYIVVYCGIL